MSCGKYFETTETLHTLSVAAKYCVMLLLVAAISSDSYTHTLNLERRLKYEAAENTVGGV